MNPPIEVVIENIENQIHYLDSFNYLDNGNIRYTYNYEIGRLTEIVNEFKKRNLDMDKAT